MMHGNTKIKQLNQRYTLVNYLFVIYFNIFLPPVLRSLSFEVSNRILQAYLLALVLAAHFSSSIYLQFYQLKNRIVDKSNL